MPLPGPSPQRNDRRIAVRLTKDAQRQVRGGHPWVYASSILSVSHDGAAGDLAVLFDDQRRFLAIGLYDPSSPLRVRVLHCGRPRQIDATFWCDRIDAALDRRRELANSPDTTAYRCIHGENDGFPGLVLDRYDTTYVLKLYTHAFGRHLATLVPLLVDRTRGQRIVCRVSRGQQALAANIGLDNGTVLAGDPPPALVQFRENGLVFDADVVHGQKTGYFLDQRENRARVRDLARGARVLDVFSCAGGFSVAAAAGGAIAVHSVDQSPHAIAAVRRNLGHNRQLPAVAGCATSDTVGDAFAVMRALAAAGDRFDLLVVDPPSFASKQADAAAAVTAYRRLTRLALDLCRPGALLVQSSCSSHVAAPEFFSAVHDAANASQRRLHEIERTEHAVDHPIGFVHGAYLKTLFARVS